MTSSEEEVETLYDLDLIESSIDEYQKALTAKQQRGDIEVHPPHAITVFAMKSYDLVFDPMLQDAMQTAAAKLAARGEDPTDSDGTEVLKHCVIRTIVNSFVAGYETRERGHSFHRCKCGDLTDDKIEELFGDNAS